MSILVLSNEVITNKPTTVLTLVLNGTTHLVLGVSEKINKTEF